MYEQLIRHINTSSSKDEFYRRIIANKDTILSQLIFKKHWELARDLNTTPAAISTIIGLLKALSQSTPSETPDHISSDRLTSPTRLTTPNTTNEAGHTEAGHTEETSNTTNINTYNNNKQTL